MLNILNRYLNQLIEKKGSDLHIKSASYIRGRVNGDIVAFSNEIFSYEDSIALAKELLGDRYKRLKEDKSIDFTYKFNEEFRFRANIFFQVDGISAVFRAISNTLPTIDELQLPNVIKDFCTLKRGLVLVTGPTGSGKTTTLASMINEINHARKDHIITIEDPVEFIYKDNVSMINQRAIGENALDFSSALRAALREDPDIILVGEMRDLETIETVLHAAETGHLVLSTLHTIDAKETLNRIIGMFPSNEHNRITMSLASVLQGIVSQRLVGTKEGKRTAATEILVKNARIESLILEGFDGNISDVIAEGKEIYKSQTFDQALLELFEKGIIDEKEAIANASKPSDLQLKIDFSKSQAKVDSGEADDDKDIFGLKT